MKSARYWLALAALVVVLDQFTKYLARLALSPGEAVVIAPFFNLTLVFNTGAAFSFLSDQAGWQRALFIVIALAASAWIVWLLARHPEERRFAAALTLVLGGAIGNVIDRILTGAVVDFLDFHALGYHWPAFNVADSSIFCGAVLLAWDALRQRPAGGSGGSGATTRRHGENR
ncbi:MAG: lipoprotein signal peptidase [Burkholderiales bacterium]|nr:lipoprotein signal peptidase [Burkholderiales bacterium]